MVYKQNLLEGCLSCCLHYLANLEITPLSEENMLLAGLRGNDFAGGHLFYLEQNYKIKTIRYIHNQILFDLIKPPKTNTIIQKIDFKFINSHLSKHQLILLVDIFSLNQLCGHYPHWIVLLSKQEEDYQIYDPMVGIIILKKEILHQALRSLYYHLWMAPQLIVLDKN
jgi:hypothetical protein